MQVLAVRCGVTKNLGNYESARIEIEASPSDGQTADDLLGEVKQYLETQVSAAVEASQAAAAASGAGKGKSKKTEAPLKADPTAGAAQNGKAAQTTTPTETPAEQPATKRSKGSQKAQRQAAASKAQGGDAEAFAKAKKELAYTLEAETMDELLERFNGVSQHSSHFGDKWEAAITKIADRYRKLNTLEVDAESEVIQQLKAAFKREREVVERLKGDPLAV